MGIPGFGLAIGLAALYVSLVVHEFGHLAAGKAVGFQFGVMAVGPVWVVRSGKHLRVQWRTSPRYWGPMAMAFPADGEGLARRFTWCVAGGPLASLWLLFAALAAWPLMAPSGARSFVLNLALTSGCLFLATAQPFIGTGIGIPSDGRRVWDYLRGRRAVEDCSVVVALDASGGHGVRPRDWRPELVQRATEITDPPPLALEAYVCLLRHALDRRDLQAARGHAQVVASLYPDVSRVLRGEAAAELAFWHAYVERDATVAETYLRDAEGALVEPHRVLRAAAALALRTADVGTAREAIDRAARAFDESIIGVSDLDRDLIDMMRADVDAGAS